MLVALARQRARPTDGSVQKTLARRTSGISLGGLAGSPGSLPLSPDPRAQIRRASLLSPYGLSMKSPVGRRNWICLPRSAYNAHQIGSGSALT